MDLLNSTQILGNLRRTAEKGYISLLNKTQIEELALKYFGIKDSYGKYIGYMCPYSGKIYSKKTNLVLEHIIPVDSKGGTVLFNCIPTSKEVNGKNAKWNHHLISWWITSKYWDNEAPTRLEKLINYILEAYDLVFKEFSIEEIEESYQEVLEKEEDLITSKRQNKKLQEHTQSNNIHSYLGFLLDCIKQLEKENINTTEINIKLKELEEKNIFKDIEKYTLFQNILKQVIIKFTGDDTKSYLTYSIKFDIKKLMDSIPYNNEQEIYDEIDSRFLNIQELLSQNNLVIEEYFNSLKELESINIIYKPLNLTSEEEKKEFLGSIRLGTYTKIAEYIELLNQGYVPKYEDKETKFSNGDLINYFWGHHKRKIKEQLENNINYKIGYTLAKTTIKDLEIDKIEEFIELLNEGYIPKRVDKETKFSNGDIVNFFWKGHKEQIKEKIKTEEKYKNGYEKAKTIIKSVEYTIDKIAEYIDLLNQGYIPKSIEREIKFSNGDILEQFWPRNKEKIKLSLEVEDKYKVGYEMAKEIIYNLENQLDKIGEYIELLNQGYKPKKADKETKFSNGEIINYFWPTNREKIKLRLQTEEKYKGGYEVAKAIIYSIENPLDKIGEYIELLNQGYIPKSRDYELAFSNGDLINQFWPTNQERIRLRLQREEKYKLGYEVAKTSINNLDNSFDKISEYIKFLNRGYVPKFMDKETKFSNGDPVNYFWGHHRNKIKEQLKNSIKYKEGYEIAKKTIYNIENPLDKIAEFIELLNKGYIPKARDKEKKFSNGDLINYFWFHYQSEIKEKLKIDKKYKVGYEVAKATIYNIDNPIDKIEEYIKLLNHGYIIKREDNDTNFSNGDFINTFWRNHKEKIISKLFKELNGDSSYNIARQTILNYLKVKTIEEYYELEEKKKQLKELKKMKQNLENVDKSLEINETINKKRA